MPKFSAVALQPAPAPVGPHRNPAPSLSEARPNDNRASAGHLSGGVLTLNLEARETVWYPEEKPSPGIPVYAFAERGRTPEIPGPLLRVPAGTEIRVTIRNSLPKALRLRGLQDRQASALDTFDIAPGAVREIRFSATTPGTFFYWGRAVAGWAMERVPVPVRR